MPTLKENREQWTRYDWSEGGDEWSSVWGGTDSLWYATLLPRLHGLIPAGHILEIAPGFGRCTQYLVPHCERLTLLDLTERCIEACRERFREHHHVSYHINDGRSLDAVEDNSVDLVFSWDSLVHVEQDVMRAYISQLGRKLRPGGAGFIHHSNIGAFRDRKTGTLTVPNSHWRGATMSARLFREYCEEAGLSCHAQEIINWGNEVLSDCISLFSRPERSAVSRTEIFENRLFMDEAARAKHTAGLYRITKGAEASMTGEPPGKTAVPAEILSKIGFDPSDAASRHRMGLLLASQDLTEQAVGHFQEAVRLDPRNFEYQRRFGDFLLSRQISLQEALKCYISALAVDPSHVETLMIVGNICVALKKFVNAAAVYRRVLELEPGNPDAACSLEAVEARLRADTAATGDGGSEGA